MHQNIYVMLHTGKSIQRETSSLFSSTIPPVIVQKMRQIRKKKVENENKGLPFHISTILQYS